MESKPLYSSRIVNTYIKYVKKCYENININELYEFAKMEPYEVEDQNHWFTQEQINLFHEKLTKMTGSTNIAREAGRYAASPESIGVMRQYMLGMINPAEVYILVSKVAIQFSRSAKYEAKKINSKKIEIVVTPHEGVKEEPFQCENRIGQFEAVGHLFNMAISTIDHTECIFKGGRCCRYIVSWESNFASLFNRTRNIIILLLAIISAIWIAFFPVHMFLHYAPVLITAFFLINYFSDRQTKKELRNSIDNIEHSRDDLIQQMEINYNNSQMVHEIGATINKYINIDEILKNVTDILEKRLRYDRCLIIFANEERKRLVFKAGYGYDDKQLAMIKATEFDLTKPQSKGVFVTSFREQKPCLINDIKSITSRLSQKSLQFMKEMGSQSFICCPIISDTKSIGILTVDNLKTKKALVESDLILLMGVASVLGVSIRNAELHDQRTRQLKSILKALAASIDARDPFTAGHSEKVTEYALGICLEMNIPKDYTEVVGVAASLHDYGKIGISDNLLKKEGMLTEEEYEIIKTHSVKTRNILEQIDFHGGYKLIPEIAEAHHEKLDGSGYPRGLRGMEIPIGSRIIAVADFFEAITAKRLYHDPMPVHDAFELLRRESDVHFSREIVEAFINFYKTKYELTA
ncbi:MAG: HD domain-containing protein [Deltaproteobacteria bacterium]|nr:HD domain-containing protein [Deltaproteobacteria bacterium]